ncbi:MAG: hypothetical protein PHF11_05895 [Candidatus Omnitrophica bacterium]|nr:hypothetical protein [Candidatus Omnitrophota bacterium]
MVFLKRLIASLGIIFLILLVLFFSLFWFIKHLRIKEIVEREIEHSLGINVTIEKLEFSPLLAHIGAYGITVHNPPGFNGGELAYISALHAMFDPVEMLTRKKPNIYLFTVDLNRLNIIKNKDGRVNIKEIIPIKEDGPGEEQAGFYFDVLVLSVGRVSYAEYAGQAKKVYEYPIGLKNAAFIGLKDENEVVKEVIYRAIQNTSIGRLINLSVVPVVSQLNNTLNSAWDTAKSGAKGAMEIATLPFTLLFGKSNQ